MDEKKDLRQIIHEKYELLSALERDIAAECRVRRAERIAQKSQNRQKLGTPAKANASTPSAKSFKSPLGQGTPLKQTAFSPRDRWLSHADRKKVVESLASLRDSFAHAVVSHASIRKHELILQKIQSLKTTIPKSDIDLSDEVEIFGLRIQQFIDRILGTKPEVASVAANRPDRQNLPPNFDELWDPERSAGFSSPISVLDHTHAHNQVNFAELEKNIRMEQQREPHIEPELERFAAPVAPSPSLARTKASQVFSRDDNQNLQDSSLHNVSSLSSINSPVTELDQSRTSAAADLRAVTSNRLQAEKPAPAGSFSQVLATVSEGHIRNVSSRGSPEAVKTANSKQSSESQPRGFDPPVVSSRSPSAEGHESRRNHHSAEDDYQKSRLLLELQTMELEMSHARSLVEEQLGRVRNREVQRTKRILEESEHKKMMKSMDTDEEHLAREISSLKREIDSVSALLRSQLEITKMLIQPQVISSLCVPEPRYQDELVRLEQQQLKIQQAREKLAVSDLSESSVLPIRTPVSAASAASPPYNAPQHSHSRNSQGMAAVAEKEKNAAGLDAELQLDSSVDVSRLVDDFRSNQLSSAQRKALIQRARDRPKPQV
eukprot:ANDGO_06767.mRNA.1 hypothetical protein